MMNSNAPSASWPARMRDSSNRSVFEASLSGDKLRISVMCVYVCAGGLALAKLPRESQRRYEWKFRSTGASGVKKGGWRG